MKPDRSIAAETLLIICVFEKGRLDEQDGNADNNSYNQIGIQVKNVAKADTKQNIVNPELFIFQKICSVGAGKLSDSNRFIFCGKNTKDQSGKG